MEATRHFELPRQLATAKQTSISHLSPELEDLPTRVVRGVVTITWPYNSVKNSFAFILAEPDFRLRRNKGQVRVNFTGPAAENLRACGLGGNDEIYLSLHGAEWEPEDTTKRQSLPGASIDWQLKFCNRLILQARLGEARELKVIDIDQPVATEPANPPDEAPILSEPQRISRSPSPSPPLLAPFSTLTPVKDPRITKLNDEYASPAFIKRARLSYGSLFEDGYDIFEDDGGVKGKGRKRTRFGRESGAWKFSSQSTSPEPSPASHFESEHDIQDATEEGEAVEEIVASSPSGEAMVVEGRQTVATDIAAPTSALSPTHSGLQHSGELSPVVDMTPHSPPGLVNHGVQAAPQDEDTSPSEAPVTAQPFAPLRTAQYSTAAELTPFSSAHDLTLAEGVFAPAWEPKPFDGPSLTHTEEPTGHGHPQPAENPLAASDFTEGSSNNQLHGLEAADQMNFMYSPIQHASFGRDIGERNYDTSGDIGHDNPFFAPASVAYPPLDAVQDEQARPSVSDLHDAYPRGHLEEPQTLGQVMGAQPNPFQRGVQSSEAHITAETRPWAAVNIESGTARAPQANRPHSADGGSTDTPLIIDDDESDAEPDPAPTAVEDAVMGGHADALEQYEDAEVEDEADAKYSDDDEPEYEEDEIGGDYDTRNYVGPDDDEDDSHDEDLQPHELEEQFDDAEEWDEEDELEDEELLYESDSEGDYDEDEDELDDGNARDPIRVIPQAAPAVIDLISSSEDEGEDDVENKNIQPPQSRTEPELQSQLYPTASSPVQREDHPTDEEPPEDGFVSQDDYESESEHSITSDAPRPVDEGVSDEEEEDEEEEEEAEGVRSTIYEERPDIQLESASGVGEADEEDLETRQDATFVHLDNKPLEDPSVEAEEASDDGELTADKRHNQAMTSLTAAEDLDSLGRTTDQRETDADSAGPAHAMQVDLDQEPTQVSGDGARAILSYDIVMADDEIASHVEPVSRGGADESEAKDTEMVEVESIVDDRSDSVSAVENVEAEDIVETSSGRLPTHNSEEPPLGPSPFTQSFPPQFLSVKEETRAAGQLPTPLNTQGTDGPDPNETPDVAVAADVEESLDTAQGMGTKQASTSQVITVEEQVTERGQVHTVEIIEERTEKNDQGQIQIQRETLLVEDDVEESSRASQSPESSLGEAFQTQPDDDDVIQAALRGEASPVTAEPVRTDHTFSSDEFVNSSFRSQMQSDEELQASILEDNSYEFDERDEAPSEAALPSSQREDQSQHEDREEAPTRTEAPEGTGSPILGSVLERKAEDMPAETPGTEPSQELSQVAVESDQESSDEESQADPSVQLARAANAATKRGGRRHETSPEAKRPGTRSQDARRQGTPEQGDASVELARASMSTPSKVEEEGNSLVEAKLQLARHLRDELPDCTQLQVLRHHTGQSLDVMAVAMMQPPDPQRARRGPREYMMSFTITDQSAAPGGQVVEVQLYRPHKDVLPVVKPGDIVLLRGFRVVALQGKGFGLRTEDASSWAVWEDDRAGAGDDDGDSDAADVDADSIFDHLGPPQIRGPPIEAIEKEIRHAAYLRAWFRLLDAKSRDKLERSNQKIVSAGRAKGKGKGK